MPRAMDECLSQQIAVIRLADNPLVGSLVFHRYEPVASGVQGQHGDGHLAVVDDVIAQISQSAWIGCNSRSAIQCRKIGIQAQSGSDIQRLYLRMIDRVPSCRS